ncbi:hypothetical protein Dimus_000984, partial [Dionaea muscipula]
MKEVPARGAIARMLASLVARDGCSRDGGAVGRTLSLLVREASRVSSHASVRMGEPPCMEKLKSLLASTKAAIGT